jgi:hypothetical protein
MASLNRSLGERQRTRYEPEPAYALADGLKRRGVELHRVAGPWRPAQRRLRRPGRRSEREIPVLTNGVADIAVDTAEHAADLSGFLNWCGVDHLEPASNFRPPAGDLAQP